MPPAATCSLSVPIMRAIAGTVTVPMLRVETLALAKAPLGVSGKARVEVSTTSCARLPSSSR